jgi:hypothetical protein
MKNTTLKLVVAAMIAAGTIFAVLFTDSVTARPKGDGGGTGGGTGPMTGMGGGVQR